MRVLIIGVSGFIGSFLTRYLTDVGYEVIGVDKQDSLLCGAPNFTFHKVDLFAYLYGPIPEVDVVVPLQGQIGSVESVKRPIESLRDSVMSNRFLLDRLIETGQKPLVVFVSSDLCYRKDSQCNYSAHKKLVEHYLRTEHRIRDIPYVILRTATCYGPLQKRPSVVNFYVKQALEGKTIPVYGSGDSRQAFIYIEDAVRCIQLACEGKIAQNCVLPLVSENLRIIELAEVVSEVVGGEIEHVDWPELAWKVNVGDLPIELLPPKGWFPEVKIHEGIKRTAEWMKEKTR